MVDFDRFEKYQPLQKPCKANGIRPKSLPISTYQGDLALITGISADIKAKSPEKPANIRYQSDLALITGVLADIKAKSPEKPVNIRVSRRFGLDNRNFG